jgi:hypothetical protein
MEFLSDHHPKSYSGHKKTTDFFYLQKPPSFFGKRAEIPCIFESTNHGTLGFSWKYHEKIQGRLVSENAHPSRHSGS